MHSMYSWMRTSADFSCLGLFFPFLLVDMVDCPWVWLIPEAVKGALQGGDLLSSMVMRVLLSLGNTEEVSGAFPLPLPLPL